jgi:hypothetical protein
MQMKYKTFYEAISKQDNKNNMQNLSFISNRGKAFFKKMIFWLSAILYKKYCNVVNMLHLNSFGF